MHSRDALLKDRFTTRLGPIACSLEFPFWIRQQGLLYSTLHLIPRVAFLPLEAAPRQAHFRPATKHQSRQVSATVSSMRTRTRADMQSERKDDEYQRREQKPNGIIRSKILQEQLYVLTASEAKRTLGDGKGAVVSDEGCETAISGTAPAASPTLCRTSPTWSS